MVKSGRRELGNGPCKDRVANVLAREADIWAEISVETKLIVGLSLATSQKIVSNSIISSLLPSPNVRETLLWRLSVPDIKKVELQSVYQNTDFSRFFLFFQNGSQVPHVTIRTLIDGNYS